MKKLTLLVLAMMLVLTSLAACKDTTDNSLSDSDALLSYKDLSISDSIFGYELAFQKANFVYNYFGTVNEDIPELWTEMVDGKEFSEVFMDMVLENCKKMLYYANYATEQGYELTEDDILSIEKSQEALIERFGSEEGYREFLAEYNVTLEDVYDYTELGMLYSAGYEMMFGYEAPEMITDAELYEYYTENFITTRHVYLNSYYKLDENGQAVELTEEEKAAKTALMDNIQAEALKEGSDFEALIEQYNEDENSKTWANGFTFTDGTFGLAGYEEQTLHGAMEIGEIKRFDLEGYGIFLVKRYALSEDMFAYFRANIESILIDEKADAAIAEVADEFKLDKEKLAQYDVASAKLFDLDRYYAMGLGEE